MICYKDRTFCSAECKTRSCFRNWNDTMREEAIRWWGGEDVPVAFADLSEGCPDYQPEE